MNPLRRFAELTEDWKYFTHKHGLRASLRFILSDLADLPYRHLRFVILARSLLEPYPEVQPRKQIIIRPFTQEDLDIVRQIDRPSEARLCAKRLQEEHHGLIGFCEGRPAGYTWGSMDPHTRLERIHPRLSRGDVLCTDSYTAPEFRGYGMQTALTIARFNLFRELGCERAICCIEVRNAPSLAVWQRKFHSQTIGTIDFIRFGPWYRVRYNENEPV